MDNTAAILIPWTIYVIEAEPRHSPVRRVTADHMLTEQPGRGDRIVEVLHGTKLVDVASCRAVRAVVRVPRGLTLEVAARFRLALRGGPHQARRGLGRAATRGQARPPRRSQNRGQPLT